MIGSPTALNTSGHRSHHIRPSYSFNNNLTSIQTVITDIHTRKKSICKLCVRIEQKTYACIILVT